MATLQPKSLHPTLSIPLPEPFRDPAAPSCHPYVLVALPPALYLDPWQYSTDERLTRGAYWLSAQVPANVELERPALWDGEKLPLRGTTNAASRGRTAGNHAAHDQPARVKFVAGQGYVTAEDDSPVHHHRTSSRHRDYEAILMPIRKAKAGRGSVASHGSEHDTIKVPLHSRYQAPKEGSVQRGVLPDVLSRLSLASTSAHGAGNYVKAQVEGIEAFWVCDSWPRGVIGGDEVGGSQEQGWMGWERVRRPSTLLPPTHSHLTSALLSHLPDSATKRDVYIFRRTDVLSKSASANVALSLPTGDAGLALSVYAVTQTVMWLLAIAIIARVHRLTK
ncbi:unnamed protein product [Parajaminaea phylloscopi]